MHASSTDSVDESGAMQRPLHGMDDFDGAPRREHPVLPVEGIAHAARSARSAASQLPHAEQIERFAS